MDRDSEGTGKELTFIKQHLLSARHLLVCLRTPRNEAREGRNCRHRFSDGETEAHGWWGFFVQAHSVSGEARTGTWAPAP